MSYILEALKRAEAERERGGVPGLHAQQVATSAPQTAAIARNRIWLAGIAAVVLGGIAVGLWVWRAPQSVVGVAAAPPVVVRPAAPTVAPAPPAVAQVAPAKPLPLPLAKASATPAAVPAPVSLPLLGELSEDLRRQVPALTITGAVYSDNPAQRLLLVNGLVLAQGAQVAPELTVEEIGVRSSVLSFRGTRFRLAH